MNNKIKSTHYQTNKKKVKCPHCDGQGSVWLEDHLSFGWVSSNVSHWQKCTCCNGKGYIKQ